MSRSTRATRRPRPTLPTTLRLAAVIAIAMTGVACDSTSRLSSSSSAPTNPSQAQAEQDSVSFARCMRSHGVPKFPDDLNFHNVPGINPSSPAFKTAQTACHAYLPVKTAAPAAPSTTTYTRLVRLAHCLRTHGYPTMPDPRPNPPPQGGSSEANKYSALYGEGDYWIGIPSPIDAHGAALLRTATACGATGVGR